MVQFHPRCTPVANQSERVRRYVRGLRERHGERLVMVAGGGVQQPADALALLDAGADLVQLHSGLVYNGPGLAKRTNEALLKSEVGSRKSEGGRW